MNVYPQPMPAPNAELLTSPKQLAFEFADLDRAAESAAIVSASTECEPLAPVEVHRREVVFGRPYRLDMNCDQITRLVLSYRLTPLPAA